MSEQSDLEWLEQERYDALQEIAVLKNDIKKLKAENKRLRVIVDYVKAGEYDNAHLETANLEGDDDEHS